MKLRLFQRKEPGDASGIQGSSPDDTLSKVSVACITLTPEGEITEINAQAYKALRLGQGNPSEPGIFVLFSVCQGKKDLLPEIFEKLRHHTPYGDLPPWTYIQLHGRNLKFYIEGCFVGHFDRRKKLHRIQFLFRNIEEEISQRFILDMAMSQTRIFPWFFDLDNNRMTIDRRWYTHLGIPNDDDDTISAETFFGFVHPEDREMLSQAFAKQLAGELIPDTFTYRLRRGDGTWEWFEEQSIYLGQSTDGSPYRIVGICQSIQGHKNTERHLREARDKARENDRLKSAFLANMSHEIRTPLNAIIGFASLLTSDDTPFSEEERQEYSHLITANGDQLLHLISDILDLSKIESNTMEFNFGEQSLHTLLSDIYQSQLLFMSPEIELRIELPQDDTTVITDSSRLKQVINNLINNAVKFTDKGSITFGYRPADGTGNVELFVRDTGKGISQEHQQKIFERFYKADSYEKGVGLGLSICRTITEILGGSISVYSVPGEGSCFTVVHPIRRKDTQEEGTSATETL